MITRDPVKRIRDLAKKDYIYGPCCEICSSTENLELHHYHSVAHLVHRWSLLNRIKDPGSHREEFIASHREELYEDVATLCKAHHVQIHKVYGKNPPLGTIEKQRKYVRNAKELVLSKTSEPN